MKNQFKLAGAMLAIMMSAVSTINAQVNLKWSHMQSLSGGIYPSIPVNSNSDCNCPDPNIYVASNEFISPTMANGLITKYDTHGNLKWNLTINPAVDMALFPKGGIPAFDPSDEETDDFSVCYNTSPTTSHLLQIDSTGTINWDIVLSGINNLVACVKNNTGSTYVLGLTQQLTCGVNLANGVAIAKYNNAGLLEWTKTKYYSCNFVTEASGIALDDLGNVIVYGKKATYTGSGNDRDPFILKYDVNGNLLWTKEFNDPTTDVTASLKFRTGGVGPYTLAYETTGINNSVIKSVLKQITTSGAVSFTKTINNAEFRGLDGGQTGAEIFLATSLGIKAYNTVGTQLWSNNISADADQAWPDDWEMPWIIAKNVSGLPDDFFLNKIDEATGAVIMQKNLSAGNPVEFNAAYHCELIGDGAKAVLRLKNQNYPPYGTRTTVLAPCSEFTYSFGASTVVTNVSGSNCNNGKIKVDLTGTFNSWPHIELWNTTGLLQYVDTPGATSLTFQNLAPGNYTVKVFDESCGEQDFNVTVKCPKPNSNFAVAFPSPGSVTLSWNAVNCAAGYKLQYRQTGIAVWTKVTTSTNSKTITGLPTGATFEWQVATKCNGSGSAVYSAFSSTHTFTIPVLRLGDDTNTTSISTESKNKIDLEVFPNPVKDLMTVSIDKVQTEFEIHIINLVGQPVIKKLYAASEGLIQKQFDISIYPDGIYFVKIISAQESIVKRFIKE